MATQRGGDGDPAGDPGGDPVDERSGDAGDPGSRRRDRLVEARASTARRIDVLAAAFAGIVDAATDVATDDEHDPEGHTIAWERQQTAALLDEARRALGRLDAALDRVDAGTDGVCAGCGAPIGAERLDALPSTTTCVACAR